MWGGFAHTAIYIYRFLLQYKIRFANQGGEQMYYHLYHDGDKTCILPGDKIRKESTEITFHRNGERLQIKDDRGNLYDTYPLANLVDFLQALTLASGRTISIKDKSSSTTEWIVT